MKIKSIQFLLLFSALALVCCKTNKKITDIQEEENINAGKILVEIQPDYSSDELAADFSEYNLTPLSMTSKKLNAWAFSFNADKIEEAALLALLSNHEFVVKSRSFSTQSARKSFSPLVKKKLPVK